MGDMREGVGMKGHIVGIVLTFSMGRLFKGGRSMGQFQSLGEGGQFTLNIDQVSCNFGLKGFQEGIGGGNFRGQYLDVFLVMLGFIL
jgi:hypothetical protein